MNSYAYAKPPTYSYQTFDRRNLQFTNYPVFTVHTPEPLPPDTAAESEAHADDNQQDVGTGDESAADDVGEINDGKYPTHSQIGSSAPQRHGRLFKSIRLINIRDHGFGKENAGTCDCPWTFPDRIE